MFEKLLGFKRAEFVELEHDRIARMLEEIHIPTWSQFERTISPVWFEVLNNTGHNIEAVYRSESSQELKTLFEEFFVNGLSDGSAVGQKMKNPRTALKYWKREKQRLHKIENMANLQNTVPDYKLYDFGQPWLFNHNKNYVNFELSDHYFFCTDN
tara:strand:+ start:1047 stop:1511 length:465 start_codon:yes stop_codon:yes gene_type:complete